MADRPPPSPPPFREPRLRLRLARLALAWEAAWPRLWPLAMGLAVLLAVALFDLLPGLPGWLHLAVLALAAGGLGWLGWRALAATVWPDAAAARRRLERDSGARHRPLTSLHDLQATGLGDPGSRALWQQHVARLRAALPRWRVGLPQPNVAALDRFGLRAAVGLVLVIAMVIAAGDWRERLERAVTPVLATGIAAPPPRLDLYITPPDYTGLPPIFVQAETGPPDSATSALRPLRVPTGATVRARVSGGSPAPDLMIGTARTGFAPAAGSGFEAAGTIEDGTRLAVTQGGEVLGSWPMTVVPDLPPAIRFADPPSAGERGALRLAYEAEDDYGLVEVSATLRLELGAPAALDREPLDLPLGLSSGQPTEAGASSHHDLTAHPWAGQTVSIRLNASDGIGQTGNSGERRIILPERRFEHPVAREIVELRRDITVQPDRATAAADALSDIAVRPGRYHDDTTVFLGLRSASRRLERAAGDRAAIAPVRDLLWDIALRLEDGDLSLAERALRDAQQALREALDGDAAPDHIAALMDDLRQALDRYLQALHSQLMDQMAQMPDMPPMPFDPELGYVGRDQLQDMLDRMQDLAETGSPELAQQMLSQLQDLLESLQTGMPNADAPDNNPLTELFEQLQGLVETQQQLLDQSFEDARNVLPVPQAPSLSAPSPMQIPGAPPPSDAWSLPGDPLPGQIPELGQGQRGRIDPGRAAEQQAAQEALRRTLGEAMRQMGDQVGSIPRPFGEAEQAMRRSEQALGDGRPDRAVPSQGEAVERLREGMGALLDEALEQMAQQGMGAGAGLMPRPQQRGRGQGRDPLGRPTGQGSVFDRDDVDLPADADVQRARAILDEVRRRLDDPDRPGSERDYLERLLRRF